MIIESLLHGKGSAVKTNQPPRLGMIGCGNDSAVGDNGIVVVDVWRRKSGEGARFGCERCVKADWGLLTEDNREWA